MTEIMVGGQGKAMFYVATSEVQMWGLAMSMYDTYLGGSGTEGVEPRGDQTHGAALMITSWDGDLNDLYRVFCTDTNPAAAGYVKLNVSYRDY
jgi:hypothetical protein